MALRQRLLHDLAELQISPYPNIKLFRHKDITSACLILIPNGERPLHLTVVFGTQYPLCAPTITIQSSIVHPNVFGLQGGYICASILNTDEGYTPAYTMKGIAIQLLSFFSSDTLEQDHGGGTVDLAAYRASRSYKWVKDSYKCTKCDFAGGSGEAIGSLVTHEPPQLTQALCANLHPRLKGNDSPTSTIEHMDVGSPRPQHFLPIRGKTTYNEKVIQPAITPMSMTTHQPVDKTVKIRNHRRFKRGITGIPDEICLLVCNLLETEDLMSFARAWNRIGGENGVLTKFDIIRKRELQCFTLKQGVSNAKLGVGVHIVRRGRQGQFESEFDLLSLQAFEKFHIRRSVQGLSFEYWLPLPISRRHYKSVKDDVEMYLQKLGEAAQLSIPSPANVIYHFMNDVVIKFSEQTSRNSHDFKSTLKRASEKAVESSFGLFHLLLCLATADDSIVRAANRTIDDFLHGNTSKGACPNLGHLLIAVLISDIDMTQDLTMAIIKETIIRNVV